MNKEFTPETSKKVIGFIPNGRDVLCRTPLHIEFGGRTIFNKARQLHDAEVDNPEMFNAVGSLVCNNVNLNKMTHLPLIDVDGGATVEPVKTGSKVIMIAGHQGTYAPDSQLRDVLGDYGIDAEVFQVPRLHKAMSHISGSQVTSVVLRSKESELFDVCDSTYLNHRHLYLQKEFLSEDHTTLIRELGRVGIVSERWIKMTEVEGMSILRTPWTKKDSYYDGDSHANDS